MPYKELNELVHQGLRAGHKRILLKHVCGQRFIGAALTGTDVRLTIEGVPSNDLGIFMDGPTIVVKGNGEDHVGNTMNDGLIVVHGHAGDVLGLLARGGKLFVKGDAGFRVGIHIKEYKGKKPTIVIGGCAKDYFGEYMAGGVLVALGLDLSEGRVKESTSSICGNCLGSGIHNGVIYLRCREVPSHLLGVGAKVVPFEEDDRAALEPVVREFADHFEVSASDVMDAEFTKIVCEAKRPFRGNYCGTLV
ncbi:MAG: hypothetical protein Kow0069_03860 [Promethearchaeota archaeon]